MSCIKLLFVLPNKAQQLWRDTSRPSSVPFVRQHLLLPLDSFIAFPGPHSALRAAPSPDCVPCGTDGPRVETWVVTLAERFPFREGRLQRTWTGCSAERPCVFYWPLIARRHVALLPALPDTFQDMWILLCTRGQAPSGVLGCQGCSLHPRFPTAVLSCFGAPQGHMPSQASPHYYPTQARLSTLCAAPVASSGMAWTSGSCRPTLPWKQGLKVAAGGGRSPGTVGNGGR